MSKWYRLDNAAKIFPPSRSKNDYKVFRFSATLLEPVKVDILNKALDETLEEYPIFKSSLKKGIFWYYLEEVNKNYEVDKNGIIDITRDIEQTTLVLTTCSKDKSKQIVIMAYLFDKENF